MSRCSGFGLEFFTGLALRGCCFLPTPARTANKPFARFRRKALARNAWISLSVDDDAIIAFLMFCLEIYQAEQQRKRKLH